MRERDKGGGLKPLGACGHLWCLQRPCKPLDSFSGLCGELREGGGGEGYERRVKGLWLLGVMLVIRSQEEFV